VSSSVAASADTANTVILLELGSMPVLGNGFARVGMMPSGLADRIANQVASQKARRSTVSIAVRFRKREF